MMQYWMRSSASLVGVAARSASSVSARPWPSSAAAAAVATSASWSLTSSSSSSSSLTSSSSWSAAASLLRRQRLHTSAATSAATASVDDDAPTLITAAVARAPDTPFTIEQVHLRAPRQDEVLVRITATGLCHTDVAVKTRDLCAFPIVLGHEGVGVVERVGSGVAGGDSGVNVGDHVLLTYASCGACAHCDIGKPAYCYEHGSLNFAGTHADGTTSHSGVVDEAATSEPETIHGSFFRQSSFASHALCTENNLIVIRDSTDTKSLASLAPLGCGVQTGAGAVMNTLAATADDTLAVFGCGAVGLSAVMAANVQQCRLIVAVDLNEERLKLAKELGATHTLLLRGDEAEGEVAAAIGAMTDDGNGVHYALDTSGNAHALRTAFDTLRPLGVCGLIGGAAPGTDVKIEMLSLLPGKQLRGIIQGDAVPSLFIPHLLRLHRRGLFPFDKLITFYDQGLDDLNRAVEESCAAGTSVIKPVLRFE